MTDWQKAFLEGNEQRVVYQEDAGLILCGDCLEVMRTWPDGCVDLVLTDPPYPKLKGNFTHFNTTGVAPSDTRYSSVGDIWQAGMEWIDDAWRLCRLGFMTFCSYHSVDLVANKLPFENRVALLTWDKVTAPMPVNVNNVPHFYAEYIWAYRKNPGLNWKNIKTVMRIPNITAGCVSTGERFIGEDNRALHPTQKPLALMEYLLRVGGEIVFDAHCGLGTTCVAAKKLGRRYIGIDISPNYCQIAKERLIACDTGVPPKEARQGQGALFE